ncbi:MAG: rhodanese-like domain-containing protein [Chthoniobacteraceae bacterium]
MAPISEISVVEAQQRLKSARPPTLIDVRERDEWAVAHIEGAQLLPLSEWPAIAKHHLKDRAAEILIHCHHGSRSAHAVAILQAQGFTNVTNVAGGIDSWSENVDPAVPRY